MTPEPAPDSTPDVSASLAPAHGSEKPLTDNAKEALWWFFEQPDSMTVKEAREYIEREWGRAVSAELKAWSAASQNVPVSDGANVKES